MRIYIAPLGTVGTGDPFVLDLLVGLIVLCDTTPLGVVTVLVGIATLPVIVKIGVVSARYWVVDAIPSDRRPVAEMLWIWIQFTSPDGFAVHRKASLSTMTSPPIVMVFIATAL